MSDQPSFLSISTRSAMPEEITSHHFPSARRGLDPEAVRRYLEGLANQVSALRQRESELLSALAEAERRAVHPVLDEAALTSALGTETGRVLQVAHEAARDVVANAEARAAAVLAELNAASEEHRRVMEAEAFMASARTRAESETMLETAKEQCRSMVDEAREARRRILSDLAERRRLLHVQLEQLRAGKDALTEVVDSVAHSVEEIRAQLQGSEEHVRAVAEDAGRYAVSELSDLLPDELLSRALAGIDVEATLSGAPLAEDVADDLVADLDAGPDPVGEAEPPSDEVGQEIAAEDIPVPPVQARRDQAGPAPGGDVSSSVDELFKKIRENEESEHEDQAGQADQTGPTLSAADEAVDLAAETVDPMISRRSLHLDPATADLGRALKKAMRLEQNELLDALRHLDKGDDGAALLPGTVMEARIAEACLPAIISAYRAGSRFGNICLDGEEVPADRSSPADSPEPQGVADELASEIVGSLHDRIEPALGGEGGEAGLASAVGVAFRDWKGARAESVAADFTTRAFSLAVLALAQGRGAQLSWIVDDGESLCPECDDNSLTGALQAGETFPTGHSHPPIHPGCRCLIVPSLA